MQNVTKNISICIFLSSSNLRWNVITRYLQIMIEKTHLNFNTIFIVCICFSFRILKSLISIPVFSDHYKYSFSCCT